MATEPRKTELASSVAVTRALTGPTAVGLPALEGLAYSEEQPSAGMPVPAARYGWGWVADRAALLLVLLVTLAGGIVVVGYLPRTQAPAGPPPGTPPEAQPPPAAAAPPTLIQPPDANQLLSGDAWYLSMVNAGLAPTGRSVSNPAGSVDDGHRVCGYMAAGHTREQTVAEIEAGLPASMSPTEARTVAVAVVNAAVRAYCPD